MTHDSCRTGDPEYSKSGIDVLSSTTISRTAAELMTRSVHQRYARNSGYSLSVHGKDRRATVGKLVSNPAPQAERR